jgi:hypothetical protein
MALTPLVTLKLVKRLKARPGSRIAAMGYPDIITSEQAIEALTEGCVRPLAYRLDSDSICMRHSIVPSRRIPDAESFFGLFNATLDVFDVVKERGGEILCDLNEPIAEEHVGKYDFVLDVGTMEHCFNVAQAARNMASLLNVGGVIFHENPFNWGNHGFYGFNPTWYADFYGQPGFTLHDCRILTRDGKQAVIEGMDRFYRFIWNQGEANCYAVAERTAILPIAWPTQTKYKRQA